MIKTYRMCSEIKIKIFLRYGQVKLPTKKIIFLLPWQRKTKSWNNQRKKKKITFLKLCVLREVSNDLRGEGGEGGVIQKADLPD